MEQTDVLHFLKKRDLVNFTRLRSAHPGDDLAVGAFLVETFSETHAKKLPNALSSSDRERELRDVSSRRVQGVVRVLELGYRIIGSYSLLHPGSHLDESWTPETATLRCLAGDPEFHSLRLSERLLQDALTIAQAWRVKKICLHVMQGAKGVAKLYERFGFRRCVDGDKISHGNALEAYLFELPSLLHA